MVNQNNTMPKEEDVQNIFNSIQAKCPVNVFNFDLEQYPKSSIIGMYLMFLTSGEIEKEIYKYAIKNGIKYKSILFFERHHIVELCAIINGAMEYFVKNKFIDNNFRKDMILELAVFISNPCTYENLSQFIANFANKIRENSNNINPLIISRLKAIMRDIWFVPYTKLDEIAKSAKTMYDKDINNSGDNNESNK